MVLSGVRWETLESPVPGRGNGVSSVSTTVLCGVIVSGSSSVWSEVGDTGVSGPGQG